MHLLLPYPKRFAIPAVLLALVAGLFLSLPVRGHAQGAGLQEPGIEDTIRGQIAAFMADDFDAAFDFASPNIQRLFGTPERFGQMVQGGYPMVYRPEELRLLDQQELGAQIIQRVLIRDAQGRVHVLAYQMIRAREGGWLINGVQILRAAETGV